MIFHEKFDVLVVGAGHAGIEAAVAAANVGAKTLLLTMNLDSVGHMPCNPAIGGLGKGHLVKEIDAMGGVMGRAIDATGIQFRRLNTRKGPAVWSSRAQADRILYSRYMKSFIEKCVNISLWQDEAVALWVEKGKLLGVKGRGGVKYPSSTVVLCPGTFMNGLIHIGLHNFPAGRAGAPPAKEISEDLKRLGFPVGRLKTGTPPRLNGRTINYDGLQLQGGDEQPTPFSYDSKAIEIIQKPCHITHTNEKTHEIIRGGLDRSPLYSGVITGIGPRYCPSIEDKIVRFPDRNSHQVHLEPEGSDTLEIYPNGISTSLPLDVQLALVRSIKGLERAEIMRPGYAVEYDFVQPTDLYATLESKRLENLFLAGQINGTSGYEEAGAQGLLGGLNAALKAAGKSQVILGRHQAYLGVLVDDLVTKGTKEPYRMFTSRAEFRLLLREDNADRRLTPLGVDAGCVGPERAEAYKKRVAAMGELLNFLKSAHIKPGPAADEALRRVGCQPLKESVKAADLLKRPEVGISTLKPLLDGWPDFDSRDEASVEIDVKYEGYVKRDLEALERLEKIDGTRLPADLDYEEVAGLAHEVKQILGKSRPMTLGQALRIPGVRPSAAAALLVHLKKQGAG